MSLPHYYRRKIALHCQVSPEQVFGVHDVSNIYHVPLLLEEQHMSKTILERLRMESPHAPDLENWTVREGAWAMGSGRGRKRGGGVLRGRFNSYSMGCL